MKVNIIGAGTWGTTLGCLLESKKSNSDITIWQRSSVKTNKISVDRLHPNLKDYRIPKTINFTSDLNDLNHNALTIIAIPSSSISDVLSKRLFKNANYMIASKGFDINTGLLTAELLESNYNIKNNVTCTNGQLSEIPTCKKATCILPNFANAISLILNGKDLTISLDRFFVLFFV